MTNPDLSELAGRIEGIGRVLLTLIANLEDRRLVDGQQFTDSLRQTAAALDFEHSHLQSAKHTLYRSADSLDAAREHRQTKGDR